MTDMTIPASRELAAEASGFLNASQTFKIATTEQYELAGDRLRGIKALRQKIAETFDQHIKRAHEAHKALVKEKSDAEAPLTAAEGIYKRAMLTFQQDQERRRQEEQARAEEAARKEREKLEAQAAKAEERGKVEKAETLRAVATTIATPVIASTTPKVSGISTRSTWRAEVTSKPDLIKAVAAGTVPMAALDPNDTFLNQQARSLKNELNYPGVKAVEEKSLASRAN